MTILRRIVTIVCSLLFVALPSAQVFALTEDEYKIYSDNHIYFYDRTARTSSSYFACTGDNSNYAGDRVWSDAELAVIKANQSIYEEAADKYDFPWQVMATLHSIEWSLQRSNPGNGQGVYQLYSYTRASDGVSLDPSKAFLPAGPVDESEFRRQTMIAAEIVSNMVGDLNEPDNVKKLFFQYNGTSSRYKQKALDMGFTEEEANRGEGSVYVMNRYDALRDPTSAGMSSYWPGRFVYDRDYVEGSTTTEFGAFVKYMALGETSCTNGGGAIADTALLLSWDGKNSHSKNDPSPEYIQAMKAVGSYTVPCGASGDCAPIGASCDQFVGTVMRYSDADTKFPIFNPQEQENYMLNNPDMYQQVEANGDYTLLQPGDIFVTTNAGKHIYIYVGIIDGQMTQASASYNDRTAEHYGGAGAVYFEDGGIGRGRRYYNVYRRINYD